MLGTGTVPSAVVRDPNPWVFGAFVGCRRWMSHANEAHCSPEELALWWSGGKETDCDGEPQAALARLCDMGVFPKSMAEKMLEWPYGKPFTLPFSIRESRTSYPVPKGLLERLLDEKGALPPERAMRVARMLAVLSSRWDQVDFAPARALPCRVGDFDHLKERLFETDRGLMDAMLDADARNLCVTETFLLESVRKDRMETRRRIYALHPPGMDEERLWDSMDAVREFLRDMFPGWRTA